jgi:hypothetical protein
MLGFFEWITSPIEYFLDAIGLLLTVVSMIPPVFGVLLTMALVTLLIRLLPL